MGRVRGMGLEHWSRIVEEAFTHRDMGGLWLQVVREIWATRQVERRELDRKNMVKVSNGNT